MPTPGRPRARTRGRALGADPTRQEQERATPAQARREVCRPASEHAAPAAARRVPGPRARRAARRPRAPPPRARARGRCGRRSLRARGRASGPRGVCFSPRIQPRSSKRLRCAARAARATKASKSAACATASRRAVSRTSDDLMGAVPCSGAAGRSTMRSGRASPRSRGQTREPRAGRAGCALRARAWRFSSSRVFSSRTASARP